MSAITELRSRVEAVVRRGQRGMRLSAGDRLIRGIRAVRVLGVGDGIEWIDTASGIKASGSRAEFLSRAIQRLSSNVVAPESILDAAWDVAGARGAPPRLRAQALQPFIQDASEEERATIRGWIDALLGGEEPTK